MSTSQLVEAGGEGELVWVGWGGERREMYYVDIPVSFLGSTGLVSTLNTKGKQVEKRGEGGMTDAAPGPGYVSQQPSVKF